MFDALPIKDLRQESANLIVWMQLAAESILETAIKENLLQEDNRRAFALALWKKGESTPLLQSKVGITFPSADFRRNCWKFVEEKIVREFQQDHISSWLSRDVDLQKYGGAITIPINPVIWGISVSGLKEFEDEAVAIIIAIYVFKIRWEDQRIQDILAVSENHAFTKKLFDAVRRTDSGYYDSRIK